MEAGTIIQLLIGLLITIVLTVVQTARAEGQKDRTEILNRLEELQNRHTNLETRLTLLEHDFADIDPHPSRHRRPE